METLPRTHELILEDARDVGVIDCATEERHFHGATRENRRRACRHAFQSLVLQGLLRRMLQPKSRINPNPAPFYLLSEAGGARLANHRNDMGRLLDRLIVIHTYAEIPHRLEVSEILLTFRDALQCQSVVELLTLYHEQSIINPDAPARERYGLLAEVGDGVRGGRMVCAPDGCVVVRRGAQVRIYFVEKETGSDDPNRVSRKKSPGYFRLHQQGLFRRIWPEAQDFRVIVWCPSRAWRDTFRHKMQDREGGNLWLAVASRGC